MLLVAAAWLCWPYVTLYRLVDAVDRGDEIVLQELVDWPAIRIQVREILTAKVATEAMRSGRGAPSGAEAFGAALAGALIGPMIDNLVTAQMLASARRLSLAAPQPTSRWPSAQGAAQPIAAQVSRRLNWGGVRWAAPSGLTTFKVVLGARDDPPSRHITVIFEFRDFGWKLTRLALPSALLN
ncbi:MAG: DUF2939 domain-containing protein [Paracraurococcus sp.]